MKRELLNNYEDFVPNPVELLDMRWDSFTESDYADIEHVLDIERLQHDEEVY